MSEPATASEFADVCVLLEQDAATSEWVVSVWLGITGPDGERGAMLPIARHDGDDLGRQKADLQRRTLVWWLRGFVNLYHHAILTGDLVRDPLPEELVARVQEWKKRDL